MIFFRDMVDWIDGWPFEVTISEEIFRFYRDREFTLVELKTCGGKHGGNEFILSRPVYCQNPATPSE